MENLLCRTQTIVVTPQVASVISFITLDAVKKATNVTADMPPGRGQLNIEPVVEFYASQADVILLEVEAAAGEFLNCDGAGSTGAVRLARQTNVPS